MLVLVGGLACLWVTATGCVSHDEYLREKFGRRKAVERAEALERELADERARSKALEAEREDLLRQLDQAKALAETLKSENERLDALVRQLQQQLDDLLGKGIGDVKVVEIKLPPELDKALKEFAAKYPDQVEYDPLRGAVRWKSDLTFALGSDEVRDTARASLKAFADIVNTSAALPFDIVIVGHTDDVRIGPGTAKKHPTNWHLSVHRSVAVLFVLNQDGVNYKRMAAMGYGEFRPRVANPPRGGAEANRRVEIYLVSRQEHVPGMDTPPVEPSGGGQPAVETRTPKAEKPAAKAAAPAARELPPSARTEPAAAKPEPAAAKPAPTPAQPGGSVPPDAGGE
jgi:chemotaxis protein MotB